MGQPRLPSTPAIHPSFHSFLLQPSPGSSPHPHPQQGPITHPWGPRIPRSTAPSTRPAGPCPSSGHHANDAKLSSEVAGHPAGEGAGPGCPQPSPPAPGSLDLALPACHGWAPAPALLSGRRLPCSPASYSLSQTSDFGQRFPRPWLPLCLRPPAGAQGATWAWRG